MRRGPRRGWRAAFTLALVALLALPALAWAAGIQLDRSPVPPQAIQRGAGAEQSTFTISYQTIPDSWVLRFRDPLNVVAQAETSAVSPSQNPVTAQRSFAPTPTATVGRWRAEVDFNSSAGLEATATAVFDVADQVGTLQLVKWEDTNGNGTRDAGEPGVPNWQFRLVNPQGNPSAAVTGADGTVTIPSVPAGTWTVTEVVDPDWAPITPVTGTVTVPANGTGVFQAGNVRPAPVSGVVYIDTNRNGIRDAGEIGRAGVRLDLTGTRPGGIAVTRTVISGADGSYTFAGLLPGTYAVSVAVPGGLTATSPRTISGIGVTSGTGSPNNNFGLNAPNGTIAGGPAPDVTIDKNGPASARAGSVFSYSITVRNRSRFTARDVEVTDLVPIQLTLVRVPSGATIRNGVVTWSLGDLAAGRSRTLTMQVRVNPNVTGRITNTATVTAEGMPPKRSTAVTRVSGPAPVARTGGVTG
jgi:uncharacterized repeat protein (TIGR01451 family)